jgi:pilus assembly protein CpaB
MNVKTVIPLALAIILGLFAAMAAKNMIDKNKGQASAAPHYTQVVVAKDNISAGSQLRPEDLTVGKMAGDIPAEAIFNNPGDVTGRVVTSSLVKGQPIMEPVLAPKGSGAGLQALVPKGMRAITIEVNDFSGVGGFLFPGCHVDIIAMLTGGNNEQYNRTVVQNIKVVAVNSHLTPPGAQDAPEGMHSVTLVAYPGDVEKINLACGTGRPHFVLRASGDDSLNLSDGVTLAELRGAAHHNSDPFGNATPVAATQPAQLARDPHSRSVQVIRGGVESEVIVHVSNTRDTGLMTGVEQDSKPIGERN